MQIWIMVCHFWRWLNCETFTCTTEQLHKVNTYNFWGGKALPKCFENIVIIGWELLLTGWDMSRLYAEAIKKEPVVHALHFHESATSNFNCASWRREIRSCSSSSSEANKLRCHCQLHFEELLYKEALSLTETIERTSVRSMSHQTKEHTRISFGSHCRHCESC